MTTYYQYSYDGPNADGTLYPTELIYDGSPYSFSGPIYGSEGDTGGIGSSNQINILGATPDDMVFWAEGSLMQYKFAGTAVIDGNEVIVLQGGETYGGGQSVTGVFFSTSPSLPAGTYAVNYSNNFGGSAEYDLATGEANCFLAGTHISTPNGEIRVESLRPGDLVMTADGASKSILWVGAQTIVTRFADPVATSPIRIRAGSLGGGAPVRDLLVSPGHGLFIDGLLVNAGALVNGGAVAREKNLPERFQYFHVELEEHGLLVAEGVLAESYLPTVEQAVFDNQGDRQVQVAGPEPMIEMPFPRATARRQVPATVLARFNSGEGTGEAGRAVA